LQQPFVGGLSDFCCAVSSSIFCGTTLYTSLPTRTHDQTPQKRDFFHQHITLLADADKKKKGMYEAFKNKS
jgi:hypothetical protein